MASQDYLYTQADFPNGAVDNARLKQEISASSIVTALDYIEVVNGDDDSFDCNVWFKAGLSAEDKIALDGDQSPAASGSIIGDHSGEPLPSQAMLVTVESPLEGGALPVVTQTGKKIETTTDPADPPRMKVQNARVDKEDDKWIVAPSPAPPGTFTMYTAAGDQLDPPKRGAGTRLKLKFAAAESFPLTKTVTIQFIEPVNLHDGKIMWRDPTQFSVDDEFRAYISMPPTVVTPNGSGTGNCTVVGGYLIVPAAGDGDYDVDLAAAVPMPDSTNGYYMVNRSSGTIQVGVPTTDEEKKEWIQVALFTDALPATYRRMFLINPETMIDWRGLFEIEAYLVEWISERWTVSLEVTKNAAPAEDVEVGAQVMIYRKSATEEG